MRIFSEPIAAAVLMVTMFYVMYAGFVAEYAVKVLEVEVQRNKNEKPQWDYVMKEIK